MSQLKVCDFCSDNILRSAKSWDYHQPSSDSLAKSASSRCVFCTPLHEEVVRKWKLLSEFRGARDCILPQWLHKDIPRVAKRSPGDQVSASLYRWSIRSLGKTRESKETVAITFRAVPQKFLKEVGNDHERVVEETETFGLSEHTFYCFPEADLDRLLDKSDIGVSTNPEANDGVQIKRWIKKCDREHKYCPAHARQQKSEVFVPTRLLVVGRKGSTAPIKVVETKPNNIRGPYVTLSHCWGVLKSERKDTLLQKNKKDFMTTGIPWNWLSRNFQHAIEVARFLDMEFCWIDSLCIIQGDREDWAHEGQLMHKVYRNSYCNMAAADSEDSTGGLFRKRESWQVLPARFISNGDNRMLGKPGKAWRVVREDLWEEGLLKTPLYTRGWVFQERMLAPRILHFSANQIFWDCAEMSACETLPSGLPLPLDYGASADRHWRGRLQESGGNRAISVSGKNDDSVEDFWRGAVRNYTSCNLTQQTDKRIAIWGIAKLVRDSLSEDYGAGMWEQHLEEQLAWSMADWRVAERPEKLLYNPSWSWTSIKGTVLLENRSSPAQIRVYTVKNHEGEPLSFQVKGGAARPLLHRERSGDPKEDIAVMGKELETVAERRKSLSRKATIQLLHDALGTPDQIWIVGMLFRVWQAILLVYSHFYSPPQQPQHSSVGYHASRDKEPELVDNTIAIQGYINSGTLQWSTIRQKWNLDLDEYNDAIIDAFPDTVSYANKEVTKFVILALSHYTGDHMNLILSSEETQDSWYSGIGIMIQPSRVNPERFVRTGALQIRHLSAKVWKSLRGVDNVEQEDGQATKAAASVNFFLE